ncbi:MAG: hypothetical protein ACI8RZ_004776 [Myxococcota bacterium]|jgi:hypothetical protein
MNRIFPTTFLTALLTLTVACVDKDPDEEVDEDTGEEVVEELTTWYADNDGDGFGAPDLTLDAAEQPSGYVADNTDCNDGRGDINPDADELCDALDNNCNDIVDEDAVDSSTWYTDADADGYGDPDSTTLACDQPSGTLSDATDCNDESADQYPNADELCNLEDDDCDKSIDEDAIDAGFWYADVDGDGYGDFLTVTVACDQPSGTVVDDTDCDDIDPDVHPGAEDVADGRDQDCDAMDGFIFSEDFESYAVGDYIGSLSYNFATWTTGSEGGSEDVQVSDEATYDKSSRALTLDESDGDDLVLLLGPATGSWLIEWYMLIDTGAYFNLQGLSAPFGDWQNEVHVDENGLVYDDSVSTGVEVAVGEWVLVEYYIDLDLGTQDLYIDGTAILSDTFTGSVLGAIDFFPTLVSSSTSEEAVVFHVDNVIFSELGK